MPTMLIAIHDVGPRFETEVDRIRDFLSTRTDATRIALLVVPNHWGQAPLRPGSPYAARLRRWTEEGNEIFLHGWFHRDRTAHPKFIDRMKARHLTAGEAEFLGIARSRAIRLMKAGSALLQDVTGRPVSGFVAPAWLYSKGAREALTTLGLPLAEDHRTVWHPPTGEILSRDTVISWASRSYGRILSSIAFARASRTLLRHQRQVRIALHPADLNVESLRRSISDTIAHFGYSRRLARYADLLVNPRAMEEARIG
jgi:predicted deacetylase